MPPCKAHAHGARFAFDDGDSEPVWVAGTIAESSGRWWLRWWRARRRSGPGSVGATAAACAPSWATQLSVCLSNYRTSADMPGDLQLCGVLDTSAVHFAGRADPSRLGTGLPATYRTEIRPLRFVVGLADVGNPIRARRLGRSGH